MSYGTNSWGSRGYGDSANVVYTPVSAPTVPSYTGISPIDAWGRRAYGGGAPVNTSIITTTVPIAATSFIRYRRSHAVIASFHRRHQYAFIPLTTIRSAFEYLVFNVGVHFYPPEDSGTEYLFWNLGLFGSNVRNLYIPHKRWPIQRAFDTLAALQRDPESTDLFVADLYEAIGLVRSRPEFTNYRTLETYSDELRAANVMSPSFAGINIPYTYEQFGIRATAQSVVEKYPDVPHVQEIADHVVNHSIQDYVTKSRIFMAIKHWTTSAPTRLGSINTRPDYLAHAIDPIPHIPDDLQFTLRNIRNRMALQERTNLIRVQHWAVERFLNVPGWGTEYIVFNIRSMGAFGGYSGGLLGSGVIGQPLSVRVASGRAAAARRRRGRVSWP